MSHPAQQKKKQGTGLLILLILILIQSYRYNVLLWCAAVGGGFELYCTLRPFYWFVSTAAILLAAGLRRLGVGRLRSRSSSPTTYYMDRRRLNVILRLLVDLSRQDHHCHWHCHWYCHCSNNASYRTLY